MSELLASACSLWTGCVPLVSRPHGYTRTLVYREDGFEVMLLHWAAGAQSAIHDHGGQHCWLAVLAGSMDVIDYARLDRGDEPGYAHVEARGTRQLVRGELDLRQGRFDVHRVVAANVGPAVSLHVYARPLHSFLVYDEPARRCEMTLGTYDAEISIDAQGGA